MSKSKRAFILNVLLYIVFVLPALSVCFCPIFLWFVSNVVFEKKMDAFKDTFIGTRKGKECHWNLESNIYSPAHITDLIVLHLEENMNQGFKLELLKYFLKFKRARGFSSKQFRVCMFKSALKPVQVHLLVIAKNG